MTDRETIRLQREMLRREKEILALERLWSLDKEQPVIHEVDLNRIRLVEPKRLPRWVALVGTLLVIGMFMWLVGEFVKGFSQ